MFQAHYHFNFNNFLKNFIYLTEQAGGVAEGEREAGSLAEQGASQTRGSIPGPWDHDLSGRQKLNQLSHPSAPLITF